jgi:SAM-dependent methyltransferase
MGAPANELEHRRWNDEHWASVWPRREQLTSAVTDLLLEHLHPAEGQRVLDVGSGGGTTAFAVARVVGSAGSVVGADISVPLVRFATGRAQEHGMASVRFTVADVQLEPIDGGPFDAVVSQFGVMFFDEPAVAFANIRAHAATGARLAFACWQPADRNPWWAGHAVSRFLEPPAPPPPGKSPAGPFALGDADRTLAMLATAGWADVQHTPYLVSVAVERETIMLDDEQMAFMGITDDQLDEARNALDEHLAGLQGDDGRYEAPLAFQIFTATA